MKSPLAYIGGKSKLSKTIIEMMPDHQAYCEVFAGAGWVFYKKDPVKYEVINDIDSDLVSFYRVLQNHLEEFMRQFKWLLTSREWFHDYKSQMDATGLTDIQRAARYYYLQRLSFGGRVRNRTFGTGPMHKPRINLLRMEEDLSDIHLRLSGVTIENLDWQEFVKRYDRAGTLLFLDPPYYKAPYYASNMELQDYAEMATILTGVVSKFILTLNDHPDIRGLFNGFKITPVSLNYTVSKTKQTIGRELIITNY